MKRKKIKKKRMHINELLEVYDRHYNMIDALYLGTRAKKIKFGKRNYKNFLPFYFSFLITVLLKVK